MAKDYDQLQENFELVVDRLHPQNFNKQYNKDNRKNLLHTYGTSMYKWVIERGFRQRKEMDEFIELMKNKKVARALSDLIEEYNSNDYFDEDETKIGVEFVIVINEVLNKLDPKDELYLDYYSIAMTLIEKRVNKMVKRTNISEALAKNLLFIMPKPEIITRDHVVGIFVNKIVRRLYSYAFSGQEGLPQTKEELEEVFKFLFGKHRLDEVVISLALEKRQAQNNNNENFKQLNALITTFVADYIEGQKKKQIKELLLRFADRRLKDREQKRDGARRLQINTLATGDYPKIKKVVKKLTKDERLKSVF